MNKPFGYDEADSYEGVGSYRELPPGGYLCLIKKAEVVQSKNGNEQLKLYIDIADGEYKDFFQDIYNQSTKKTRTWPSSGTFYQGTTGTSLPFFKGLITSIEKSNFSYKWNWEERTLTGKAIGAIFRREEYKKQDGKIGTTCKPYRMCSCDTILAGVDVPADKLLSASEKNDRLGEEVQFDENDIPF